IRLTFSGPLGAVRRSRTCAAIRFFRLMNLQRPMPKKSGINGRRSRRFCALTFAGTWLILNPAPTEGLLSVTFLRTSPLRQYEVAQQVVLRGRLFFCGFLRISRG